MIADLHCHTSLSDGSMSLDDLIFYASRAGLDCIAVTDHDTMDGVSRAAELGERHGIKVIPAAEISCYDKKRRKKVHILCYMPDRTEGLQLLFDRILRKRTEAGNMAIQDVTRLFPVTEEHISRYTAASKSIYRSHIMRALIDLGYDVKIYGELYTKLFDRETGSCYHGFEYPDVLEVLDEIRLAGGIAVLAHPLVYDSVDLLSELAKGKRIQGVEVFHPSAGEAAAGRIGAVADQYGLIKTGGSDFHGCNTGSPRQIASRVTDDAAIKALLSLKGSAINLL
ncbi:phosphatase [Clostridia bacterium]|nr:phosphatase [Clostridia bacterium]